MGDLPPVRRPNGTLYQPRRIVGYGVDSEFWDLYGQGVVVLGTRHYQTALRVAELLVRRDVGSGHKPVDYTEVWWRDTYANGQRTWVDDPEHGRAGIWWREVVEASDG